MHIEHGQEQRTLSNLGHKAYLRGGIVPCVPPHKSCLLDLQAIQQTPVNPSGKPAEDEVISQGDAVPGQGGRLSSLTSQQKLLIAQVPIQSVPVILVTTSMNSPPPPPPAGAYCLSVPRHISIPTLGYEA